MTQAFDDLHLLGDPAPWPDLRARFSWPNPAELNIAQLCCTRWADADPEREAIRYVRPDGDVRTYSYQQLDRVSRRFAHALAAHGVSRGDRVAVLLPQTPETVLTHLAAYRLGAVMVPLFTLFGADGLRYRLHDSGAVALITDGPKLGKVLGLRDELPDLRTVFSIDGRESGVFGFWQELGKAADDPILARTGPDDPAFISYTSGTTGPPKGALHGHRVLLGHLPGYILSHEFTPQPGDVAWTPADWAWMGGLMDILLPGLALGVPVLAHRMAKFDPEAAMHLMRNQGVRNAFLPPTALKLMRGADVRDGQFLRTVASGGEALGAGLLDWGQGVFGRPINEFYGQTECNLVLSNCAQVMTPLPGSMGQAVPGFELAILDADGHPVPAGEVGEIAVKSPNPSMFLNYWNQPEKTAAKFSGP
ncbi:MAG: AMP-binding protein, partial [Pseudomonadota bacterium]